MPKDGVRGSVLTTRYWVLGAEMARACAWYLKSPELLDISLVEAIPAVVWVSICSVVRDVPAHLSYLAPG